MTHSEPDADTASSTLSRPAAEMADRALGAAPSVLEGRRAAATTNVVLALLTMFGPISLDLYLPLLPDLARDLNAAPASAQLTMTACLFGLALGQLIAGPLSDRFGRRRPVLVGVSAYVVMSAVCAVAPSVEVLLVARFLQGFAGAAGIVVAQAAGRDLYAGPALARFYGRLGVLGGLAAIIGPVAGGQLASITDWRGVFVLLAGLGVAILVAALVALPECLPPGRRVSGGLATTGRNYARLLTDRRLVAVVLLTGFVNAGLFAYLSGATFILQGTYGLSPQAYSLAFASNSVGFIACAYLAGRLSGRWSEARVLLVGLVMTLIGSLGLIASLVVPLPLTAVVACLVVLVSGIGVTTPPATSLALADYPHLAGTTSSLLGLTRCAFGGLAAPMVGLGGAVTAASLGTVTLIVTLAAAAAFVALVRAQRVHRTRHVPVQGAPA